MSVQQHICEMTKQFSSVPQDAVSLLVA